MYAYPLLHDMHIIKIYESKSNPKLQASTTGAMQKIQVENL